MESRIMTPTKSPHQSRPLVSQNGRGSENNNPNLSAQSLMEKPFGSPMNGSIKSKKSASKAAPTRIASSLCRSNIIQERKFIVVAKKNSKSKVTAEAIVCKCKQKDERLRKCPCMASESLRTSQEEFFRTGLDAQRADDQSGGPKTEAEGDPDAKTEAEGDPEAKTGENEEINGLESLNKETEIADPEEIEFSCESANSKVRRIRTRMLEAARSSIPESGSGRVMHLVKAFESILSVSKPLPCEEKEGEEGEESNDVAECRVPKLQPHARQTDFSSFSFFPGNPFSSSKKFELDTSTSSPLESSSVESIRSRTSGSSRRSRRSSTESSGRNTGKKWEKQLKVTRQKPFKLRTEQRGRFKKEDFHKKVEEMIMEEKKQRIPIAQGLPWTTDEPEPLVKPPVKEITTPIDLILHSDVRAMERAEYDHYVEEKLSMLEQYRLERERQQKLEEEEEIRRLRKELVPKAQPMPYFDRPFIPKRSSKHPTIPKEPRFHIPHHMKIKCMSWNNFCEQL